MLGLRVYLDDEELPTETSEDIQEIVAFLTGFLRLHGKRSGNLQGYRQGQLPFDFVPSISVHKMSEWLEMAWKELGSPEFGATGDEIYVALEKLGFQSTAADPKTAVKASIRLGGQFLKLGTGKNREAYWGLKDPIFEPTVRPPRFSLADPNRQATRMKVVDYAIRALKELGGKANTEDLAAKMVEHGWKTKSDDKPGLVAATLRKYEEFEKQDDLWLFSNCFKG